MIKMKMMIWEEAVRGQCPRSVSRTLFLADRVGTSKVTHTKLKLCSVRSAENATKTRNKHWMCTQRANKTLCFVPSVLSYAQAAEQW